MKTAATAVNVMNNLANLCASVGKPLNETQKLAIAGALGIWLEKARNDGRIAAVRELKRS